MTGAVLSPFCAPASVQDVGRLFRREMNLFLRVFVRYIMRIRLKEKKAPCTFFNPDDERTKDPQAASSGRLRLLIVLLRPPEEGRGEGADSTSG